MLLTLRMAHTALACVTSRCFMSMANLEACVFRQTDVQHDNPIIDDMSCCCSHSDAKLLLVDYLHDVCSNGCMFSWQMLARHMCFLLHSCTLRC